MDSCFGNGRSFVVLGGCLFDVFCDNESQLQRDGLPMDGDVSRADFTNRFHLCWSFMQSTSVVSTEGVVLDGPDEILPNR